MKCKLSDVNFIMDCLEQFLIEHKLHVEPDRTHVRNLVINSIANGTALRTDHGILLAVETPSVWDPESQELHELAFWISPDYRGGLEGGRLLKEYAALAETGRWSAVGIAQTPKTALDFSRWGFIPSFSVALKCNGK